jgi:non-ribosomal peptide synthetase component E (peptide arylation enzyme)
LEVRGAFLFSGYFDNDQANRETLREGGWFRSGDLATIDEDGNVYMTGRVKDIINRGGIKINPIDVEALVDEHPDVFFSAIVPMPDKILGEKACMFVQLKPGATMTLAQVCSYLTEKGVAKMKWPERLEEIEVMPMNPARKIVKGVLVKELRKRLDD